MCARVPNLPPCAPACTPQVVLSSDEEVFGGYRNVTKDSDVTFVSTAGDFDRRPRSIKVTADSGRAQSTTPLTCTLTPHKPIATASRLNTCYGH